MGGESNFHMLYIVIFISFPRDGEKVGKFVI